jgi:hypothetical protein
VKDPYPCGRCIKTGDGVDTDFSRDPWCGATTLKEKFNYLLKYVMSRLEALQTWLPKDGDSPLQDGWIGGGGCTKLAKTDERYHKSIYKSLLNFT